MSVYTIVCVRIVTGRQRCDVRSNDVLALYSTFVVITTYNYRCVHKISFYKCNVQIFSALINFTIVYIRIRIRSVTVLWSPSCAQPSEKEIFDFVFEHGKGSAHSCVYGICIITNNGVLIKYRNKNPNKFLSHLTTKSKISVRWIKKLVAVTYGVYIFIHKLLPEHSYNYFVYTILCVHGRVVAGRHCVSSRPFLCIQNMYYYQQRWAKKI